MAELPIFSAQALDSSHTKIHGFFGVLCSLCLHAALMGAGLAFFYGGKNLPVRVHHIALVDAACPQGVVGHENAANITSETATEPVPATRSEPEASNKDFLNEIENARPSTGKKPASAGIQKRKKDPSVSASKTIQPVRDDRDSSSHAGSGRGHTGKSVNANSPEGPSHVGTVGNAQAQAVSTEGIATYQAGAVDTAPAVIRRVTPQYPLIAKRKRVQGSVVVRIVVDSSGQPRQCTIFSATPAGYFESAALDAARKLRFRPGKIRGIAVNTVVLLPFDFRLQ